MHEHSDTVLIIDDSPDNIDLLKEILKGQCKTIAATNGEKGLKLALRESKPDLILLDIMMEGIDGYEVCRRLKSEPLTSHIPVIFITGQTSIENEIYGLELGAVDYITKPFNPALTRRRVTTQLENSRYQHGLEYVIEQNFEELINQHTINTHKELMYKSLLDSLEDSVFLIDENGLIELTNPIIKEMFGYDVDELIGKPIEVLIPERFTGHVEKRNNFIDDHDAGFSRYKRNIKSEKNIEYDNHSKSIQLPGDLVAKRKDGSEFPVLITLSPIELENTRKVTAVVHDLTERKHWENKLSELAMTDTLTGLANRSQFENKISDAIKLANRSIEQNFALLMIDLDNFKPVNDTYGHQAGDEVIKHTAKIFKKETRDVDTVARLGGDEFAIILLGKITQDNVMKLSKRIIDSINKPIAFEGNEIKVGCSIGINIVYDNEQSIDEIVRCADIALYQSKNSGRNKASNYSHPYKVIRSQLL